MPGKSKKARSEHDYYATPPDLTRAFLREWDPSSTITRILEPSAGDGAMLDPLTERFAGASITAIDINPRGARVTQSLIADHDGEYDLIFTNPPFRHAMEFANTSYNMLHKGGYLVLLLPLGFLASKRRAGFFREMPLSEFWPLSRRPSFTGDNKTDWTNYAFYVWRKGYRPKSFKGRHLRW